MNFDPALPASVAGPKQKITQCPFTPWHIMIGNADLQAVYNINYTLRYNTSKLAPSTCRAYAHELYITRYAVEKVSLQSAIGSPVLRANCSYRNSK